MIHKFITLPQRKLSSTVSKTLIVAIFSLLFLEVQVSSQHLGISISHLKNRIRHPISGWVQDVDGGSKKLLTASSNLVQSIIPQYISTLLRNSTAQEEFLDKLGTIFQNGDDDPLSPCLTHFGLLFITLGQVLTNSTAMADPQNTWALLMIDSWGHYPTEGILSGHLNSYGDYDECVGLRTPEGEEDSDNFDGQYCWVYLIPLEILSGGGGDNENETYSTDSDGHGFIAGIRKAGSVQDLVFNMLNPTTTFVMPSNAYCVPSSCSLEEVQELLNLLFQTIFPNVIPIPGFCRVREDRTLDSGAKAMIGVLSTLGFLILVGSVVDVALGLYDKFKGLKKKIPVRILLAFSLPTNVRKWADTSSGEGGLGCIHGIRFLSTCWVILSHTILIISTQGPTWNTMDVNTIYKKPWHFYVMLNGFFSVDTFFTMSGLLACYTILRRLDKSKGKINVPMIYLHRYLRLTPTYALIIGVLAHLYKYLGSGPFFTPMAESVGDRCKKYWWHNLLYFNNVYFYDNLKEETMCEEESWYIANDMQFFLLSPLFAFLLWKWRRIGMGVLGAATIASILTPGIVIGTEQLPPTLIIWKMGSNPNPRINEVYHHPWFRIGPYIAGIWMGYFLYKLSKKSSPVTLPPFGVLGGWLLSTATATGLIFGVIPYYDPQNDDNYAVAGIYGGLSRFCWGVMICWVIFACVKGYGGWINSFLSWKVFIPLGRLTFCVYLSSLSVQFMLQLTLRQPMTFDMYQVTNMFFSHVIMCFLVGFCLSMTFESPFIALEKVIFSWGGSVRHVEKSPPVKDQQNLE